MASLETSDNAAGQANTACIVCDVYQPRDGKFLSCFHVICAGCLAECISRADLVSCSICKSNTSMKVAGVGLGQQLIDCSPILTVVDTSGGDVDTASERHTELSDSPFCDPCLDMDVERIASHQCDDCADLPLCEMHAAKHPKKRASAGHCVRARGGQNSPPKPVPTAVSKRCIYHTHCVIFTYCQTCRRCICAECIAAGSHDGHTVENLASASDKQRKRMAEALTATDLGQIASVPSLHEVDNITPHAEYDGNPKAAGELLNVVEQIIADVTDEGATASKMAIKIFDEIEEMLKRQRRLVLNDIDQQVWTQLQALEDKKKRLESLLHRQTTAVDVVTRLTSPTICHDVLLEAAESAVANIFVLSEYLEKERTLSPTPFLFVAEATLDDIRESLQNVTRICSVSRTDITKSVFEGQPPEMPAGCESRVVAKLFDSSGGRIPPNQQIPAISSTIILPSGTRQAVDVVSSESDSSKLVIPVSAPSRGKLTVELSYNGLSCSLTLSVSPGMIFDPEKCDESIVLSENNRLAALGEGAGNFPNATVIAREGFSAGHHEWSFKIIKGIVDHYGVCVGVTSTPTDGNYSSNEDFYGEKATGFGYWNAYGEAYKWQVQDPFYGRVQSADMEPVADGDIMAFTLDWDTQVLRCINQRTKQAKEIADIKCIRPLHPAVKFDSPGQRVEFLYQEP